jgi:hypothetical protein
MKKRQLLWSSIWTSAVPFLYFSVWLQPVSTYPSQFLRYNQEPPLSPYPSRASLTKIGDARLLHLDRQQSTTATLSGTASRTSQPHPQNSKKTPIFKATVLKTHYFSFFFPPKTTGCHINCCKKHKLSLKRVWHCFWPLMWHPSFFSFLLFFIPILIFPSQLPCEGWPQPQLPATRRHAELLTMGLPSMEKGPLLRWWAHLSPQHRDRGRERRTTMPPSGGCGSNPMYISHWWHSSGAPPVNQCTGGMFRERHHYTFHLWRLKLPTRPSKFQKLKNWLYIIKYHELNIIAYSSNIK